MNNLGSAVYVLDNTGTVIDQIVYNGFGMVAYESAPSVDHFAGFTGGHVDPNTGLVFLYHRPYDPADGRWLTPDPKGFLAGDTNLSRYVGNDPSSEVDPTGLFPGPGGPGSNSAFWQRMEAMQQHAAEAAQAAGERAAARWEAAMRRSEARMEELQREAQARRRRRREWAQQQMRRLETWMAAQARQREAARRAAARQAWREWVQQMEAELQIQYSTQGGVTGQGQIGSGGGGGPQGGPGNN